MVMKRVLIGGLAFACVAFLLSNELRAAATGLSIGTFQVDATPPIGSPLCNAAVSPVREIVDPLSGES